MSSILLDRLARGLDRAPLDVDAHDAFVAEPGDCVLLFTEDPKRFPESNDVAVILPELLKVFPGRLRAAVVARDAEKTLQQRYGFGTWPSLVFLREGGYLGAISGVRNWNEFVQETAELLARDPQRPPSIGIAVVAEGSVSHQGGINETH